MDIVEKVLQTTKLQSGFKWPKNGFENLGIQ